MCIRDSSAPEHVGGRLVGWSPSLANSQQSRALSSIHRKPKNGRHFFLVHKNRDPYGGPPGGMCAWLPARSPAFPPLPASPSLPSGAGAPPRTGPTTLHSESPEIGAHDLLRSRAPRQTYPDASAAFGLALVSSQSRLCRAEPSRPPCVLLCRLRSRQ